ncbi:MAG TPA: hypothetical protein DIC64_04115 [Alphaproteobacteria bacterium]|nr:hypothetical protein [Alphaproteobacteria bacterium]
MKKLSLLFILCLAACTSLTKAEQDQLHLLKSYGITVDKPIGQYEKPAKPAAAGLLNLLPGFGNFYLAAGNGAESNHWLYGAGNLLFWPISILWGVPEAVVDANNINKRELIYYYQYNPIGKQELQRTGIRLYQ